MAGYECLDQVTFDHVGSATRYVKVGSRQMNKISRREPLLLRPDLKFYF